LVVFLGYSGAALGFFGRGNGFPQQGSTIAKVVAFFMSRDTIWKEAPKQYVNARLKCASLGAQPCQFNHQATSINFTHQTFIHSHCSHAIIYIPFPHFSIKIHQNNSPKFFFGGAVG
jgi:hypothetical protein